MQDAPPASRANRPLPAGEVDVAIVGGGFVGMWTALRLKSLRPSLSVVVLERNLCGSGASGRNGGFVMSWWPKIGSLLSLAGRDEAARLAIASEQAIGELGAFCANHGIDAHFRQGGWLWTATSEAQREAWGAVIAHCARLGARPFERLPDADIARRAGSMLHREGILERSNGTVHPARLVAGLRDVADASGVEVHEHTPVLGLETSEPAVLQTARGTVRARSVVLAINAWAAAVPEISRSIVPVNSSLVVTEPIAGRLQDIGWTGGEAITDSQTMVNYYRTTRDGRIVFGKATGALEWGDRIGGVFSHHPPSLRLTEAEFRRTYPSLADVAISGGWCGPIDRTYDSLPFFGTLAGTGHVHFGIGWSGNGVGPSVLGAKILASMTLRLSDQWSGCALVGRRPRPFPPEPLRMLGGTLVRRAVLRKDVAERDGRAAGWLDLALARLAPAGLEDKA